MWSALFVLGVLVEMAGCASSQGLQASSRILDDGAQRRLAVAP